MGPVEGGEEQTGSSRVVICYDLVSTTRKKKKRKPLLQNETPGQI